MDEQRKDEMTTALKNDLKRFRAIAAQFGDNWKHHPKHDEVEGWIAETEAALREAQ